MNNQYQATVYGIFKRGDDDPFYIGTTKHDPSVRFEAHMAEVRLGTHSNRHFANKVKKWGAGNVELRIIYFVREVDRYHIEREVIQELINRGVKLTNKIYNGTNYDIADQEFDYRNRPGLTPDRLEVLLESSKPAKTGGIGSMIWDALFGTVGEMVKRFPTETAEDHPGLTEWYHGQET